MTACRSRWSKEREAAEGEPEVWVSPGKPGTGASFCLPLPEIPPVPVLFGTGRAVG